MSDNKWPPFVFVAQEHMRVPEWLEGFEADDFCPVGGVVEWHEGPANKGSSAESWPYIHRDAARAWQALRDWLGPSRVCVWTQSEYDLWETDCNGAFQLNDGGPHDNDMAICCYCGGVLVEQAYEDAESDDEE
jgi:hypothetical protein